MWTDALIDSWRLLLRIYNRKPANDMAFGLLIVNMWTGKVFLSVSISYWCLNLLDRLIIEIKWNASNDLKMEACHEGHMACTRSQIDRLQKKSLYSKLDHCHVISKRSVFGCVSVLSWDTLMVAWPLPKENACTHLALSKCHRATDGWYYTWLVDE